MRSWGFTAFLFIVAALVCGVSIWQGRLGSLDTLFGKPPVAVGERLYDQFKPDQVRHIRISSKGVSSTFSLGAGGWVATSPWNDRMDPRAAVAIIQFALGQKVVDSAPEGEIPVDESGLGQGAVNIRLEAEDHSPLAKFKLGRVTPMKAEVEGVEQPVPTVYVQPRDRHCAKYIYACTGDISALFKNGLAFLRDHRPFYFNPARLKTVRIRSQQGDLTLGRETPGSPWRIVKPLDLPTNPEAMKLLLEGLFELQAVKVADSQAIVSTVAEKTSKSQWIGLTSFDSDAEVLLEIAVPAAPSDSVVKATVNNRPGVVFDLPVKPEPGLVTLANLPLAVNDLRNPTLTHLQVASVAAVSIRPATGAEVVLSRQPGKPWQVDTAEGSFEANEENVFALFKAVTTGKAIGFVSDAVTDFSPWGLDRPVLVLRFLGVDNSVLELRFGLDKKGNYYVNRQGSPSVMRVDPSLVSSIAVRSFEWRHGRVWSLDTSNLLQIERKMSTGRTDVIRYIASQDVWKNGTENDGLLLDPVRADYLFSSMRDLKVSRWLSPADEACSAALLNPSMTLTVMEREMDEDLNVKGMVMRVLTLAPATRDASPSFYYGRLNSGNNPFIISREVYQKLAVDLFER